MSNLIHLGGGVFQWILQSTWQAAVLAGLILLAQYGLRKRLSPSWRYGLWLLLVIRLLMPVSPESAFSIFNLARTVPMYPSALAHPAPIVPDSVAEPKNSFPENVSVIAEPHEGPAYVETPIPTSAAKINWFGVALYGWLAGVCFFGARLVWTNGRFRSRLGGYQPVGDENAMRLLNDCRAAFKITQQVRLIESEEVESPAVYGFWRKWLLLPDGVFERFSTEELRCIFLHELAHIKRGDLAVNWLVAVLQVLHWFNPVLWLAWSRMRADRELATDALALAHVRESDHAPYGETILKVLEGLTGERALPGLVGIVESKAQLKERFIAIARPGKSWKWAALAVAALIASLGLTGAQTEKSGSTSDALQNSRTNLTGQVESTNNPQQPEFVPYLQSRKDTLNAEIKSMDKELQDLKQEAVTNSDRLEGPIDELQRRKKLAEDQRDFYSRKIEESRQGLDATRPDLTGLVLSTNGQPLQSTIFISTAGPKVGTSTFCPSCYADCIKSAKTDAKGNFKIESLDPELIFRILVVARDCKPKYVDKLDPAKGPVKVKLESRNYADAPPGNTLCGRVLDDKGVPIVGAAVESHGIHYRDGGATWGALHGVDPLAVTDDRGEFIITSLKSFAALDVKVEARGFAKKAFAELTSGTVRHDLTMTEGAVVTGRVVWKGKPLPDVSVGIVSIDRSPENFTGNFEIGTDVDGRFAFVNLPPNVHYTLYGIMETLKNYGATMPANVTTGGDGSKVDAGDLVVGPAHRLAGRIVLDDGKPIPAKTRLLVGRESEWDNRQIVLDKDGHFDAIGFPSGVVSLSVRVDGYRISAKNASMDPLNSRLLGRLDADVTNLTILLEKGPRLEPDYNNLDLPGVRPEQLPLAGVEGGSRQAQIQGQSWHISGRVTDAKTGNPIASFQVTPGSIQYSRINLDLRHRAEGSNGVYAVELSKRFGDAVFKVEADGYLPAAVTPSEEDTTNFDFTLQPGKGPSGTVLLPDGKPAADVTVGLVCSDQQGIVFREGRLTFSRNSNLVQTTDASGRFSFAPELQMEHIAAASSDGFKLVSPEELTANPKMILEPWGFVKGTLRRPSGPGTNEELDLMLSKEALHNPYSLQLPNHVTTDEKGAFYFDQVPPGKLDLTYRVKVGKNGWHSIELQTITVRPGQTVEVAINASEREPDDLQTGVSPPKPARKRGLPINGTVVYADGKPVAGAQVALIVPNEYLALRKAFLEIGQDDSLKTITDGDGHFTLPGIEGATDLVAVHEAGFGKIQMPSGNTLAGKPMTYQYNNGANYTVQLYSTPGLNAAGTNTLTIKLQPWGEIHGTLRIGKHLGTNESVVLTSGSGGVPWYSGQDYKSRTDDHGKFVITYAPPGEQSLARIIPIDENSWTQSDPTVVNVKAGGITEATIGGTGCEVTGKAEFKDDSTVIDWKEVRFSLVENQSTNATKALSLRPHYYQAEYVTNGIFRFEDVFPGKYHLTANRRQVAKTIRNGSNMHGSMSDMAPLGDKEVIISRGGGTDAVAFDVGVFDLRAPRPLNVGDKATQFDAKIMGGQEFHLADYRGKYVLLNIFFPQIAAPRTLSPLKEVFDLFGKNKHLAMLGVTYAPEEFLQNYARTNGVNWPLVSMAVPTGGLGFADYLQSENSWSDGITYLIDPDGKIMARDLRGAEIKSTVALALAGK